MRKSREEIANEYEWAARKFCGARIEINSRMTPAKKRSALVNNRERIACMERLGFLTTLKTMARKKIRKVEKQYKMRVACKR